MMGVDLTLMPQSFGGPEHRYSFQALRMSRDRDIWRAIDQSGKETDVGCPVSCHFARTEDGETCYGAITETPYGTKLTFIPAGELSDIFAAHSPHGDNKWIFAAVAAMPRELPIFLYWS